MTLAYIAMLAAMYVSGEASPPAPFLAGGGLALAGRLVVRVHGWRWTAGRGVGIAFAAAAHSQSRCPWTGFSRTGKARIS